MVGLHLSDALVIRNNGGRITPQVIDDLAYISQLAEAARPEGDLFEIAVIHHTQCGAARLADDDFRHRHAERIGVDESGLSDYAVVDPTATVAADVERVRASAAISTRMRVSGHVYDVASGLVATVSPVEPVGVEGRRAKADP